MEKEFIPIELTLKLVELGFNGYYKLGEWIRFSCEGVNNAHYFKVCPTNLFGDFQVKQLAITWSQSFDFFREKYDLYFWVYKWKNIYSFSDGRGHETFHTIDFKTYEEARLACLNKLIEIVQNDSR